MVEKKNPNLKYVKTNKTLVIKKCVCVASKLTDKSLQIHVSFLSSLTKLLNDKIIGSFPPQSLNYVNSFRAYTDNFFVVKYIIQT